MKNISSEKNSDKWSIFKLAQTKDDEENSLTDDEISDDDEEEASDEKEAKDVKEAKDSGNDKIEKSNVSNK